MTANRTLLKSKYKKLATNPGDLRRAPNNRRRGDYFIGRDNTTKLSTSGNFKFTVECAWLHPGVSSSLSHPSQMAPVKRAPSPPPHGSKLLDAPATLLAPSLLLPPFPPPPVFAKVLDLSNSGGVLAFKESSRLGGQRSSNQFHHDSYQRESCSAK